MFGDGRILENYRKRTSPFPWIQLEENMLLSEKDRQRIIEVMTYRTTQTNRAECMIDLEIPIVQWHHLRNIWESFIQTIQISGRDQKRSLMNLMRHGMTILLLGKMHCIRSCQI
uniref:Uncharacterized protein LOC111104776 isoform X3 n=1 Tax=Crassostrea virginica TaxID=6565 RepID=A0A8B8AV92_CRAVI|nr:uncharacterized protein LOC111104776 isoform X3 [Crassostrea virginica]